MATISSENCGVPPPVAGRGGGLAACPRTPSALGLPRVRGAGATDRARPSRRGLAGLCLLAVAACNPYVQGNGVYHEEERSGSLGPFLGLRVEEGITASLAAGAAGRSVVVSGDANVVPYIRTAVAREIVRGSAIDVLRAWVDAPSGGYSSTYPPRVTIQVPEVRFAHAEGDRTRIDLRDVATPELVLEAREQGEIIVRSLGGPALHATVADAEIDAGGYAVDAAEVVLTGASRIELQAGIAVTGEAWGTSEVDNLLGQGVCNVTLHDAATLLCR